MSSSRGKARKKAKKFNPTDSEAEFWKKIDDQFDKIEDQYVFLVNRRLKDSVCKRAIEKERLTSREKMKKESNNRKERASGKIVKRCIFDTDCY